MPVDRGPAAARNVADVWLKEERGHGDLNPPASPRPGPPPAEQSGWSYLG